MDFFTKQLGLNGPYISELVLTLTNGWWCWTDQMVHSFSQGTPKSHHILILSNFAFIKNLVVRGQGLSNSIHILLDIGMGLNTRPLDEKKRNIFTQINFDNDVKIRKETTKIELKYWTPLTYTFQHLTTTLKLTTTVFGTRGIYFLCLSIRYTSGYFQKRLTS